MSRGQLDRRHIKRRLFPVYPTSFNLLDKSTLHIHIKFVRNHQYSANMKIFTLTLTLAFLGAAVAQVGPCENQYIHLTWVKFCMADDSIELTPTMGLGIIVTAKAMVG